MVVELLIDIIPARKMQSISAQPKKRPAIKPKFPIENTMIRLDIIGEIPILRIFLTENSNPRENNKKITPMSAHVCILALSSTLMV